MDSSASLSRARRFTTAAIVIGVPAAFMVFFTLLQLRFDYPDILRRPAAQVLDRFAASDGALLPLWYGMFASALAFMPLTLLLRRVLPTNRDGNTAFVAVGMLAGLVQAVGLARWVFVVPTLARVHADPGTSQGARDAAIIAFEVLNQLLGVGIGEHLGFLFTAVWTLLLCAVIKRFRPILAAIGAVCACAILTGLLEPAGIAWAGASNALGYTGWSIWLVTLGVLVGCDRVCPRNPES